MNPTYHWPQSVELIPEATTPDLYTLAVTYAGVSEKQFIQCVHVPQALKRAMAEQPRGFHLETLERNSSPSLLLPGTPWLVVLGVTDRDGVQQSHVPASWLNCRRRAKGTAVLAAIGAVAAVGLSANWWPAAGLGCLLWGKACSAWRLRGNVSPKPFVISCEVGTRTQ